MQVLKKINWFHPDGLPIVIVRRDPPEPFGLHSHEFSEIVIIMGGKGGLMKKFGSSWILAARVRFDFGLSTSEQGGGFLEASAPASNDLAADVETWYSRKCREQRTLCGDAIREGISRSIARQWCGQPRRTLLRRDCFLDSHWTQE